MSVETDWFQVVASMGLGGGGLSAKTDVGGGLAERPVSCRFPSFTEGCQLDFYRPPSGMIIGNFADIRGNSLTRFELYCPRLKLSQPCILNPALLSQACNSDDLIKVSLRQLPFHLRDENWKVFATPIDHPLP